MAGWWGRTAKGNGAVWWHPRWMEEDRWEGKLWELDGEAVGIRWGIRWGREGVGQSGVYLRWSRSGPDEVPAAVRDVTEVAQARRKVDGGDGEREGSVLAAGSPGRGGYSERWRTGRRWPAGYRCQQREGWTGT